MASSSSSSHRRRRLRVRSRCGSIQEVLDEGKEGNLVSICGTVSEINASYKSVGTDYACTLKIMDPSFKRFGISTTFFARNIEGLPNVDATWDILIGHDLKLEKNPGGHLFFVYDKQLSSFALFRGVGATGSRPYQTSRAYVGNDDDNKLLEETRKWLADAPPFADLKQCEQQIRDINTSAAFDLVCKVFKAREESTEGPWNLYVWDGTDAPPIDLTSLDTQVQSTSALCPEKVFHLLPPVGTVLRVHSEFYFKEFEYLKGIEYLKGKDCWVRLCNIAFEQDSERWKGRLQENSIVRLLSNNDVRVLELIRMYQNRLFADLENEV